jgi:hypothetical protein
MTAAAFEIVGAGGDTIAVEPGEYYFNTKARGRRQMKVRISPEARQVYSCLELATMGFQQEQAVTMENGKQRPLTPTDIARQTGLSKQNVRRAMEELDIEGLAERRSDDGGPLRNGHILIYSWAVPRARKTEKGSQRATTFPAWFPPEWEPLKPLINRLRLVLPIEEGSARDYFQEGADAARDYQKAEKVVINLLKRVCAQPKTGPPNKEERTERTNEIKGVPAAAAVLSVEAKEPPPATTPSPKITEALAAYEPPEAADASSLERACKERDPEATEAEIIELIHKVGKRWHGPGHALFLDVVPKRFPLARRATVPPAPRWQSETEMSAAEKIEMLQQNIVEFPKHQQIAQWTAELAALKKAAAKGASA